MNSLDEYLASFEGQLANSVSEINASISEMISKADLEIGRLEFE